MWIELEDSACFQESEGSTLPCAPTSERLPTVKSTVTGKLFYCQECDQVILTERQFGMTSHLCKEDNADPSKLYSAGSHSHAKTLALQDAEKVWKESVAGYFSRLCAWPKKLSPRSYSLRTSQISEVKDSIESLKKFPGWGMTVDTEFYPLRTWVRRTEEIDGGYWPTVTAAAEAPNLGSNKKNGPRSLIQVAREMWPTPRANKIGGYSSPGYSPTLAERVGGRLNPTWVEWLMGYQIGWTALEDWAMRWFLLKRGKRLRD